MEWFVHGSQILCKRCAPKGAKPVKLAAIDEVECAKCGAKPLSVRKGAIVLTGSSRKVYCPQCAKKHEETILTKAKVVFSLEDEDISPTPLWCDSCGEALAVAVPNEVASVLRKTIDGLEAIIFDRKLKETRPALWQKALSWKEKLEDYLLKAEERPEKNL